MENYLLTFKYNGQTYDAEIINHSAVQLDKRDATIIVEAIIEKQIKYVKGQYVQGLEITKIKPDSK